MKILRTVADVRAALAPFRLRTTIGLVPTMGAFHDGHVALFRAAKAECGQVAASLFVNPTQFGDARDLRAYPRDEGRDAAIAEAAGVDWLFAPDVSEMFAPDHATWVEVEGAAIGLEGAFRPGHFRGVATVCVKLFNIVRPDIAFFGQKDGQQVEVIRQVVRELNLDLVLRLVPTVRDENGLALSSRNARLSTEERVQALAIPRALEAGRAAYRRGDDPVAAARALLTNLELEYLVIAEFDKRPTLAIAVRVGATRLIDNLPLSER